MRRRKYINPEILNQFTDSKQWHSFCTLTPEAFLSDGALYVAEEGDVFWLVDLVGLFQTINEEYNQEVFQHWIVNYGNDLAVTIECEDGNNNTIYKQVKSSAYFPFSSFDVYAVNEEGKIKIMLTGEYH